MATKIEIVPVVVPTAIIQVNVTTEDVLVEFLHVDTSARKALMNLALDMAKARLLAGEEEPDGGHAA